MVVLLSATWPWFSLCPSLWCNSLRSPLLPLCFHSCCKQLLVVFCFRAAHTFSTSVTNHGHGHSRLSAFRDQYRSVCVCGQYNNNIHEHMIPCICIPEFPFTCSLRHKPRSCRLLLRLNLLEKLQTCWVSIITNSQWGKIRLQTPCFLLLNILPVHESTSDRHSVYWWASMKNYSDQKLVLTVAAFCRR